MEKLFFGLGVAGVGMLVVFVGLIILIVFVSLLAMFSREKKVKKEAKPETKSAVIPVPAPVATAAAQGIPDDVLAAITAAIACVWDGEKRFVVRHVKRISNAPAWNRAGREEQTYSRF